MDTAEEFAEAINKLGGIYSTTIETVEGMGLDNARAITKTIMFYRDEMPNLPMGPIFKLAKGRSDGVFGWIPTPGMMANQNQYNFHIKDGEIVADELPVYLGEHYFAKGQESFLYKDQEDMVNSGYSPKNSNFLENTPVHENGHNTMARLTLLQLNKKIQDGLIELPDANSVEAINKLVYDQWKETHKLLAKNAIERLGLKFSDAEWKRQAATISEYAATGDYLNQTYKYETFSEAMVDYLANGENASKFSLAIVDQVKELSERYAIAADPSLTFAKNGLQETKGLFKDGQYNFPKDVKTDAQRAKWLNEWRQKNPYLKGKGIFTEEEYRKANLWDTFFQKEARAINSKTKTTMPDLLAQKNGDFLEELAATNAKRMTAKIKEASVNGFSEDLATVVFSKNANDILDSMDAFIIKRIDDAAEDLAAKMPGGATEENLNSARITLWSEDSTRNDTINMLATLAPDIDLGTVRNKVNTLFETQAKGLAAYDILPVETKKLMAEEKKWRAQLYKENKYAQKIGKATDAELTDYIGDATQVIHYKKAGEDVYVVTNDPVITSILKRPNNYKETNIVVESVAQISNTISRLYRLGTTGANPLAYVRNVLRDPMQAMVQGGFNPLRMYLSPEAFYHTLRGYGLDDATIQEVSARMKNWAASSTMTQEMRNMGLQTPGTLAYRNRVEQVSKKLNEVGSKIMSPLEAPLEKWESTFRNQVAQQSFVKNFERTGDVNKALTSALFDASNSTTDFSHSVGIFRRATSTVPYLSSAINGTASFWRQFNVDPVGMICRITAGFMVPVMGITAWNLSDEQRRNVYKNLPEWYRDSHIFLIDLDGNVISFPVPEEIQHYYGVARRLIEYTQDVTPYGIPSIMAQGMFGFLPVDVNGFFGEDGNIDLNKGFWQTMSGLIPQAATTLYEWIWEKDMFTGADLSSYDWLNKRVNALSNIFGTGAKNLINSLGTMFGAPDKMFVGMGYADTLARDLFGMGFNNATNQFMNIVGNPETYDLETGKTKAATGLFKENEELKKKIQAIDSEIAWTTDENRVKELEQEKSDSIKAFIDKVSNLTNKYMQLYTSTGGLEEWQKEKLVKLLTLGDNFSSDDSSSYRAEESSSSFLSERSLAQQRYLDAGLPGGPSLESLAIRENGNPQNSIDVQAAISSFYGTPKQAATDFRNAMEKAGLKDIRNEFYGAIQQIYDAADAQNAQPDYDLIEKIQARYLQAFDSVLIPILNQYGVGILNNNDFIDELRKQVNGMIPSDDWRQSAKNAKKFLSTKEFPTAGVDVKKWLKQRYSSSMRNRNIDSDQEVKDQLEAIKKDIDAGRSGAAKGRIESLRNGVNKANYFISSTDYQTLIEYYNMVK